MHARSTVCSPSENARTWLLRDSFESWFPGRADVPPVERKGIRVHGFHGWLGIGEPWTDWSRRASSREEGKASSRHLKHWNHASSFFVFLSSIVSLSLLFHCFRLHRFCFSRCKWIFRFVLFHYNKKIKFLNTQDLLHTIKLKVVARLVTSQF